VFDNGPGIRDKSGELLNSKEVNRIFQSGFTTKTVESGGGLGLSWVKSIVEDFHHGTIEAMNRADGGAQFNITISTSSNQFKNSDE
jgi:C4-dicarboxylate-specific signal transduction histidine kinase